ncbi:MAG: DUF4349 domain-containing protein, partial [Solirubrobacterales bacterium]
SRRGATDNAVSAQPRAPLATSPDMATGVVPPSAAAPKSAPFTGTGRSGEVLSENATRNVERVASLKLATRGDQLEAVADEVIAVTDRFGGYVLNSDVSSGESAGATFQLQIPAARFSATLAELSKIAHVRSRTQNSADVTVVHNAAERRLKVALKRVARISALITAPATADTEKPALRARLRRARRTVRANRTRLAELRTRESFVPLALTIEADDSLAAVGEGTLERAAGIAVDALTYIAAVLLVSLAIAAPIAIIGLLAWSVAHTAIRRRRQAAIDRLAMPAEGTRQ